MGLDMYAISFDQDRLEDPDAMVDIKTKEGTEGEQIHYWRKHHDLHGWMNTLYIAKGGQGPVFNCNTVRLTLADLDALEADLRANRLPHTEGFFFGNFPPDDESLADDLEFIRKAREEIEAGKVVLYDSWW